MAETNRIPDSAIGEFIKELSLAPTAFLKEDGQSLMAVLQSLPEGSPEAEAISILLLLLYEEYKIRLHEPLWRKAQRFAIRNSETFKHVGKIAACIGAGVLLGQSFNIKKL